VKQKIIDVLNNWLVQDLPREEVADAILALFGGEPVYQIFEPYEGWRDTCLTGGEFEGVRDKKRILYAAPQPDERDARIADLARDRKARLDQLGAERRRALDAEEQRDALQARLAESDRNTLRLLETIKYLVGIAEHGAGHKLDDSETVEQFVLGYVKSMEARLDAAEKDADDLAFSLEKCAEQLRSLTFKDTKITRALGLAHDSLINHKG
jgi:hypothetical protein